MKRPDRSLTLPGGVWIDELSSIRSRLLEVLESRVGSRALAEDVVQAAFLRWMEKGATLQKEESVLAWLYKLASNLLVDSGRRQAAESRMLGAFSREADLHIGEQDAGSGSPCLCVGRLLPVLKAEYQRALRAVDVDGKPIADWARKEHISTNNASVRLHRARRALARRVRAVCGPCAERMCVDCDCAGSGLGAEKQRKGPGARRRLPTRQ
jgi:RNA polymerase sigma-70 factor (ECF subfamily)